MSAVLVLRCIARLYLVTLLKDVIWAAGRDFVYACQLGWGLIRVIALM